MSSVLFESGIARARARVQANLRLEPELMRLEERCRSADERAEGAEQKLRDLEAAVSGGAAREAGSGKRGGKREGSARSLDARGEPEAAGRAPHRAGRGEGGGRGRGAARTSPARPAGRRARRAGRRLEERACTALERDRSGWRSSAGSFRAPLIFKDCDNVETTKKGVGYVGKQTLKPCPFPPRCCCSALARRTGACGQEGTRACHAEAGGHGGRGRFGPGESRPVARRS